MLRKLMIQSVLCSLVVAAAPAAVQAQCPNGFYTLNLKGAPTNPTTTLGANVSFHTGPGIVPGNTTAVGASPAGCAGFNMAALKIVIPPACRQANVVVEYEGLPKGWTVNLGDSPTNDGFAGDSGSTDFEAEVWILEENLSLAPADRLAPLGIDNPLVQQHLSLTDGALKLVVKDQFVSWGQPYSLVQEPATKNLFSFSDPANPRTIYLGLNRVITGRPDRRGCGARRVLISFLP